MDLTLVRKTLGDAGIAGVLLLVVGVVSFWSESRREGAGALAFAAGTCLVLVGFFRAFLDAMGMEFEDLA